MKSMNKSQDFIILNTGARMPMIGLGTWNAAPARVGEAVGYAISQCGYRHLDCAAVYHNEKEVGQGIASVLSEGSIKREEIFVTSKLWNTHHARDNVVTACKRTLRDLGLDYLDLYLMHFGIAITHGSHDEPLDEQGYVITENISIRETWEAMEDLVETGLVRAIGVSNFTAPMLLDLLSYARIEPAINQIELHPYLQQERLVDFCHYKGIAVTAYSPLGTPGSLRQNDSVLLEDKLVQEIAERHSKSPAQILIRWAIQRNTIAIPKSTNSDHMKANREVFDFELAQEDMEAIRKLNRRYRFVNPDDWWKIPYFD